MRSECEDDKENKGNLVFFCFSFLQWSLSLNVFLDGHFFVHSTVNCSNQLYRTHFFFSYELMLQCWDEEPSKRPNFSTIVTLMENSSQKSLELTCDVSPTESAVC